MRALLVSDVVGDPLDVIASGPTTPDVSTFAEALAILDRFGLREQAPRAIVERIEKGLRGEPPETPKPGNPLFARVRNTEAGGPGNGKCEALPVNYSALASRLSRSARTAALSHRGSRGSTCPAGRARPARAAIYWMR